MLAAWLWVSVATAGPEEGVAKLVQDGEFERAQKRCEEVGLDDAPPLREACAKAFFPAAQQANSVASWQAFVARWTGTALEGEASEAEASAALYAVGYGAREADYAALLAQYPNSVVAPALSDRMGAAAIRDAFDGDEARRVALKYPRHEQVSTLVERYLAAFAKVEIGEAGPVIALDPPTVPASEVKWSWVLRHPDGRIEAWNTLAEAHLLGLGLPPSFVNYAKAQGNQSFPPCLPLGVAGELAIQLVFESGSAFVPAPVDPACAATAPPALFVVSGGRMSALSLAPGHRLVLPPAVPPPAAPWFPWGAPSGVTHIFAPFPAGDPIVAGAVLGQPIGAKPESGPGLFLLSPIAGGMPWYILTNPPPSAVALPVDFRTAPLPSGWTLMAAGRPVQPGVDSAEPVQVSGPAGADWWLPAGDPRVFSQLFAKLTGMNQENPAIRRPRGEPLPPAAQGFTLSGQLAGPPGSAPVDLEPLDKTALSALSPVLAALGVTASRAWKVDLGPDAPHVVFEGANQAGVQLRGIADFAGRGFVWVREPRAQSKPEAVFAFRLREQPYFAWTGTGATGPYVEAVHFEGIGLVREFR